MWSIALLVVLHLFLAGFPPASTQQPSAPNPDFAASVQVLYSQGILKVDAAGGNILDDVLPRIMLHTFLAQLLL